MGNLKFKVLEIIHLDVFLEHFGAQTTTAISSKHT